ncbi:MAG: hypothetical protein JXM68_11950, partial [Sedimentisphaerales bacterium]|nr:hypothetical protein [Sedimentisphaerales bacterium]
AIRNCFTYCAFFIAFCISTIRQKNFRKSDNILFYRSDNGDGTLGGSGVIAITCSICSTYENIAIIIFFRLITARNNGPLADFYFF